MNKVNKIAFAQINTISGNVEYNKTKIIGEGLHKEFYARRKTCCFS